MSIVSVEKTPPSESSSITFSLLGLKTEDSNEYLMMQGPLLWSKQETRR